MQGNIDNFDIDYELKKLPDSPGVYIMYDDTNSIIYVGKSVSLYNRVRSYFKSSHTNKKIIALVNNIHHFEYIIVNNEIESLVLEANLIKKHKPKYNINLKDDKQYPYIKITNEVYPKIQKVRNIYDDKAHYFGPFPSISDLDKLIEISIDIYKIRDCSYNFEKEKWLDRACINYHLNRCDAPCINEISKQDYNENVAKTIKFLSGNHNEAKDILKTKMIDASSKLEYELAMRYRDFLFDLDNISNSQIFNIRKLKQYHLISYYYEENIITVAIFIINDGLIIGRKHYTIENAMNLEIDEILSNIIRQFYLDNMSPINEVYIDYNEKIFLDEIAMYLKNIFNKTNIIVKYPKKGIKFKQMKILNKNAKEILTKYLINKNNINLKYLEAINILKDILGLEKINRIECYDISNLSNDYIVGSMVVYKNGFKSGKDYRKFRIKNVIEQDDYNSHREMMSRRLDRLNSTDSGFSEKPDLIMIDGGKGHVNTVLSVMKEKNITIPVIGLVKNSKHKTRGIIFNDNYINIDVNTVLYKFLYDIQEEVHRFAINYHRSLQNKKLNNSILDEIEGVGYVRKINLLSHFGNISSIKKASKEELETVDKIDKKTAKHIFEFFRGEIDNG